MRPAFDIAIIGAGVVGTAIARDFSRYPLRVALLEANPDFGDESSKGNSALMTQGHDTPAGTLERQLVIRGYQRYLAEAPGLGLPMRKTGALMLAWTAEQRATVEHLAREANDHGFHNIHLLEGEEVLRRWPQFRPDVLCAQWMPDEIIADPFSTPYAYVLDAVFNGVEFLRPWRVTRADRCSNGWQLRNDRGDSVTAGLVINAGGLRGDIVDGLAGYQDFCVRPRRGQYMLLDKPARAIHDVIAYPTPTPTSRGILIAPTIFGNVLVGPTAEDVTDRDDRAVTKEGLAALRQAIDQMVPALRTVPVNTIYAGMRPATNHSEYQIRPRFAECWLTVAGIRSTGFSGALGIAEYVTSLVFPAVFDCGRTKPVRGVRVSDLSETSTRPWADPNRIAADSSYAEMICHCERISVGEVRDALNSPIPPASIKALKRRTRVMFGRCQGFYCGARVQAMFMEAQKKQKSDA
ncbi:MULTISPECIES: FAD-dependent oxidoreductase [unclassified Mesorhizobium]|uniref:NAD(P)/FAD-dependent oxidoreductase n=1 Tax=unclassified Mesorhizobium TaxID=325217 RepID=UPI000FD6C1DD|nr:MULTISPECIES: FAD-dependent oxidoreductase [unclassified Mesorhizobium]TGT71907.1 FAD-dependent oxidoreductase [Mesorhizobium sp. M2E.F.Ca.ET.166.01.1.1]TGV99378.1 FAD-dependent oxidoreductase [Mesorhizobium sp. M2E.F.Ca.ET.154.01.1.1]